MKHFSSAYPEFNNLNLAYMKKNGNSYLAMNLI
jgi:hypothetical protein